MSAERPKDCKELNILHAPCKGTDNLHVCLTKIVIAKYFASLDKSSPIPADRTIAQDMINSKPTCTHKEKIEDDYLPVIDIIENPNLENPHSDDPQTLTGISLDMLREHLAKLNGSK